MQADMTDVKLGCMHDVHSCTDNFASLGSGGSVDTDRNDTDKQESHKGHGMHFDPEFDRRPLERLGWFFRYLNQYGAPNDPPSERRPMAWADIARRMDVPASDVSRIARQDETNRKSAGPRIFGRAMRAFGVRSDFWWSDIQGEPDIELHVLAEGRAGRELVEQRGELDTVKAELADTRAQMKELTDLVRGLLGQPRTVPRRTAKF